MSTEKQVETHRAPEQTQSTSQDLRTTSVKLVEIGSASTETQGTVRGVEWGFTPHG
jgi:hypothetical protein